ncbi:MAG: hypothetical protein U0Q07_07620 [Acidimicrobiales bacterium]
MSQVIQWVGLVWVLCLMFLAAAYGQRWGARRRSARGTGAVPHELPAAEGGVLVLKYVAGGLSALLVVLLAAWAIASMV